MQLVEQGKLDLDRDVSRWLGWPLAQPGFPDRPITLAMLLSHTSSVREHDDHYVIPLGGSLQAVMADPRNWDPQHGPGDNYFTLRQHELPDRRLDRREGHRRALRHLDARAMCSSR